MVALGKSTIGALPDTLGLGSSRGAQVVSELRTVVVPVADIQPAQANGRVVAGALGGMVRQQSVAAHFEASCPVLASYFRWQLGGEVCAREVPCKIPVARFRFLFADKVGSCCALSHRIQDSHGCQWCIYSGSQWLD